MTKLRSTQLSNKLLVRNFDNSTGKEHSQIRFLKKCSLTQIIVCVFEILFTLRENLPVFITKQSLLRFSKILIGLPSSFLIKPIIPPNIIKIRI